MTTLMSGNLNATQKKKRKEKMLIIEQPIDIVVELNDEESYLTNGNRTNSSPQRIPTPAYRECRNLPSIQNRERERR